MKQKMHPKNQIKSRIRELQIGDTISFPIAKTPTVRTSASEIGLILMRRYYTYTDREKFSVFVTRTE